MNTDDNDTKKSEEENFGGVVMGDTDTLEEMFNKNNDTQSNKKEVTNASKPEAEEISHQHIKSQNEASQNPLMPEGVVKNMKQPPTPNTSYGNQYQYPSSPPSQSRSLMKRLLIAAIIVIIVLAGILALRQIANKPGSLSGEIVLRYWGLWENSATFQEVINEFEANHPGVTIEYTEQSPKQYRERLQAAIQRGEGPDIFRFHNTWIPMIHTELATVPEDVMPATEFSSLFYPIMTQNLVAGESIFGIPLMIDGLGLYYNEDIFASNGVTVPSTWDELYTMIPKLTVKPENTIVTSAIALGTAGNVEHFSDIIALMMMQNGVNLLEPMSDESIETMIFYGDFADPINEEMYTWDETLDNSIMAFASGRVAMIFAPSWRAFEISQLNPNLRFKIAPVPQLPGNNVTWASYWVEGVSKQSEHQKIAWDFIMYLASRDVMVRRYTEASKTRLFGEIYSRVDLKDTIIDDPFVGAFVKQAEFARSFPLASRTFDNGINDRLIKYLEDAINAYREGTAPKSALETYAQGTRQVLGSYGLLKSSTSR